MTNTSMKVETGFFKLKIFMTQLLEHAAETIPSPVILVGPTTAGKSDVAAAISDMTGGTIITADRGYMYADPDLFWLGLGLVPGELDDDRPRRLYGTLNPLDPPLEPEDYVARVRSEVETIHSVGGIAIIEGCTRRYNRALISQFGFGHAVGISWPSAAALHGKLVRRVETLVGLGMYEEIEAALKAGYGEAHPMTTLPYIHGLRVLSGQETRPEAEAAMAERLALISIEHKESYDAMAISGLRSVVHESGASTFDTALEALGILCAQNGNKAYLRSRELVNRS